MADKNLSAHTEDLAPSLSDVGYIGVDMDGTPSDGYIEHGRRFALMGINPGGRLSLQTGEPFRTGDLTAKTTVYYTPAVHNLIQMYDTVNSSWNLYAFSEASVSVPSTTNTNYDVFGYISNGSLVLENVAWSGDTTRATAIAMQNGRMVKDGDASRRFLGTFRTTATTGQTEDSQARRLVSNAYNLMLKNCYAREEMDHRYITTTWRPWNNKTENRFEWVWSTAQLGRLHYHGRNSNTSYDKFYAVGFHYDGTTGGTQFGNLREPQFHMDSVYRPVMGLPGYHYLQAMEYGDNFNQYFYDFWLDMSILC